MLQEGLVVESRFSLRKALVRDFDSLGAVSRIYEAVSVRDGIDYLSTHSVDTCLLGPSLTLPTAESFIAESRRRSKNPDLLLMAVRPTVESSAALIDAGLHAVIPVAYDRGTFTEIVARAIASSDRAKAELLLSPLSETICAHRQTQDSLRELAAELTLSGELELLSKRLRVVVEGLGCGSFSLERDGTPSATTKDAIRLSIEECLRLGGPESTSFDRQFVEAVVEWFNSRVLSSHQQATKVLRENLLSRLVSSTH